MVQGKGYDSGGIYLKSNGGNKTKAYSTWKDMLLRCFSRRYKDKHPTYEHATVSDDWLDFQVFASWFYINYREGCQLDKDIISRENKIYSASTCRFIPKDLNLLFTNRNGKSRNMGLPLGVSYSNTDDKYIAWCNNGKGCTINLGGYDCPNIAHNVYLDYKTSLVRQKAERYYSTGVIDKVLYEALMRWEVSDL